MNPAADTTPRRDRCHNCKAPPGYVLAWGKVEAARYACAACARRSEAYAQLLGIELMVLPIWAWLES